METCGKLSSRLFHHLFQQITYHNHKRKRLGKILVELINPILQLCCKAPWELCLLQYTLVWLIPRCCYRSIHIEQNILTFSQIFNQLRVLFCRELNCESNIGFQLIQVAEDFKNFVWFHSSFTVIQGRSALVSCLRIDLHSRTFFRRSFYSWPSYFKENNKKNWIAE